MAYRDWRASTVAGAGDGSPGAVAGAGDDRGTFGPLAFAGLLLSLLSFVSVLFVGVPALVLPAC